MGENVENNGVKESIHKQVNKKRRTSIGSLVTGFEKS